MKKFKGLFIFIISSAFMWAVYIKLTAQPVIASCANNFFY